MAVVDNGASLNVTGCAFAGKLLGGGSYASGGIVGWRRTTDTCTLTNCLYAPASATGSEVWMTSGADQDGSANFCRYQTSQPAPILTNCYYTTDFSSGIGLYTAQGMQARTIAAGDYVSTLAITVYSGGISFNDGSTTTFYAGNGESVSLTLSHGDKAGFAFNQYAVAGGGTLTAQTETSATLSMTDANQTINAQWAPTTISSASDWDKFCEAVNGGFTYSGKTVKLTANISVSERTSTSQIKPFSGTFDGDGYTLNLSINETGTDATTAAPFGYVVGGTIKNVNVTGSVQTVKTRPASLVGFAGTNCTILNCKSSAAVSSSLNDPSDGDVDGGAFVACVDGTGTTITGCTFTGSITFSDEEGYEGGGFVGWMRNGSSATLTDCLFAPTAVSLAKASPDFKMFAYNNTNTTLTLNNCYYNGTAACNEKITKQDGTMQMHTIAAGDYVSTLSVTKGDATATYDVSGITVYSGGIDFNDGSTTTFYGGSGQTVSLALTAETRTGYQFKQYAASQGTLSGQTTDTPTLTMPAATGETLYTTYTATAGSGGSGGRDQSMLLDNDKSTKWIGTFTPGVYAEFNTPSAIVPTGYVLTTADDASSEYWRNRSPKTWKLYGKLNEGDSWTVLDDVADGNLPNENTTDKSYSIANTAAYKYFRYEITAIKGSTELFQLAELQLKGYDAVVISAEYDPTYNATFASGNDNDGWTIDPTQQIEGGTVTVSYTGENKVKSVKVTNKYAIAHSLAASVVGDIVGSDGNAYAVAEKDKLPVGVTAAGVVTYKSGETGIVVALQNLATKYSWSDAFTAAAAYTPAVSGQTWKLGTKDEMSNAILNDYTIKYGYITAAGGTFPYPNNYWSATEVEGYTTERAWRIWVESNGVPTWHDWDGVTKTTECQVRPIIAF